jgi:hypothetical protein
MLKASQDYFRGKLLSKDWLRLLYRLSLAEQRGDLFSTPGGTVWGSDDSVFDIRDNS